MDDNNVVGIEIGKCVRFKLKVKIVQEFMVEDTKGTVFSFFLHFLLVFLYPSLFNSFIFNFMSFFFQKDAFVIVHFFFFFAVIVSYPLLFETIHETCAFCIYIPQLCFDDDELQMYFCMTE